MNLARSASCCATCLASTARVNSGPNVKCVSDTSSKLILNSADLFRSSSRIFADTLKTLKKYEIQLI